jgi:DNA gyrase subunit A
MQYIHGPDFPTGGIVYNKKDILAAYTHGRGSVVMRGRVSMEEAKNGRQAIIVTEIPYQMNKKEFVEKVAELTVDKTIVGISEIRDESNKE